MIRKPLKKCMDGVLVEMCSSRVCRRGTSRASTGSGEADEVGSAVERLFLRADTLSLVRVRYCAIGTNSFAQHHHLQRARALGPAGSRS
jgi:hypothetical protein